MDFSEQANEVKGILNNVHGLTSLFSTSWDKGFSEYALDIDKNKSVGKDYESHLKELYLNY